MTIKQLLQMILLAVLCTSASMAQNVLIFSIDSCRADRFGVYGRSPSITPNIDEWAKGGTVFRDAYSTSAWTAPGVVSILSGLYPPTHAVNNRDQTGSEDLLTLPKILLKENYRVPNLVFFSFSPYFRNLGMGPVEREFFGDPPGEELFNWLQKEGAREGAGPFFLWYHTTLAHQPYRPPSVFLTRPISEFEEREALRAIVNGAIVPVGSVQFQPEDRPLLEELYDGEIKRVDALFGRMLQALEDLGLRRDTLVVLTADHGEELLDHGFVGHASTSLQAKLYEELVRIPLIFSWPGKVPSGRVVSRPASQIDVLPSVLSLLERPVPTHFDGVDLFAETQPDRSLFFESVIAGNQTAREHEHIWLRAIRQGRYKFISSQELYDLERDPLETRNLVKEEPELAKRLAGELDAWLEAALAKRKQLFPTPPLRHSSAQPDQCPRILSPGNRQKLSYERYTGAIVLRWQGNMETSYQIEYDIGTGSHHVQGIFEVEGNHHVFGPLGVELWGNLKAWNPFKFRVSTKSSPPCWSGWVQFEF